MADKSKSDIVREVAKTTGVAQRDVRNVIDGTLNEIERCLVEGQSVSFMDFGTFKLNKRKAYEGRNPHTGESMTIPPRDLPVFKSSQTLKARVKH